MDRRTSISLLTACSAVPLLSNANTSAYPTAPGKFIYCLNTSTISGKNQGIEFYIETAARAGYDAVELWIMDIQSYLEKGGTVQKLSKKIKDTGLIFASAIGFAPWMVTDEELRGKGFKQMEEEMNLVAALGCARIAAPAAGVTSDEPIDLFEIGNRYAKLLALGKKTGVRPLLEFWGASRFYHLGQSVMAALVAGSAEAKILPDVYHMFRGGSDFDSLKLIDGSLIDIIHMNDYPGNLARTVMDDQHRVYPGDGIAPLKEILESLKSMGGDKYLSLELFNRGYWEQDPLMVAKTGLKKMRAAVELLK
jgi:2-keto-myo-inositol isomerase